MPAQPAGADVGRRRLLAQHLVLEVGTGHLGVARAEDDSELAGVPDRTERGEVGVEDVVVGEPRPTLHRHVAAGAVVVGVVHRGDRGQAVEAAAQEHADQQVPAGIGGERVPRHGRGSQQPAQTDQGPGEQAAPRRPQAAELFDLVDAAVGTHRRDQFVRLGGGDDADAAVHLRQQPVVGVVVVMQRDDEVLVQQCLASAETAIVGLGHGRSSQRSPK